MAQALGNNQFDVSPLPTARVQLYVCDVELQSAILLLRPSRNAKMVYDHNRDTCAVRVSVSAYRYSNE